MWFKNSKLFRISSHIGYDPEQLAQKLQAFAFQPCGSSSAMSAGFITPLLQPGAPLVHAAMGTMLVSFNIEEKVLPTAVVKEHSLQRVQEREQLENRGLSKKEKADIKDQVYFTLLQQAFCRSNRIYACIDTQNHWLVVNTTQAKKLELFLERLKEALDPVEIHLPEINNVPKLMTRWLLEGQYPDWLTIEGHCKLEDYNNKSRVIACRHQDLFADTIQRIVREGCVPKQLALTWKDRITFKLNEDFSLTQLQYSDDLVKTAAEESGETEAEKFDSNFVLMTESLTKLYHDLGQYIFKSE
jgi:recombination associated protein RdgC